MENKPDSLQELRNQLEESKNAYKNAADPYTENALLDKIRNLQLQIKQLERTISLATPSNKVRVYKTELEFREFSQIVKVPKIHTLLDMQISIEGIEQRAISLYAEADFSTEIIEIEFIGVKTSSDIPKSPFKYFKTLTSGNETLHFYYR